MGYCCPVCEETWADGTHLAHHLATMAALDRPEHATWLEERVPEWTEYGPEELAAAVTPHAQEAAVDPATTNGAEPERDLDDLLDPTTPTDSAVEAVLEEARELTREMNDQESRNR